MSKKAFDQRRHDLTAAMNAAGFHFLQQTRTWGSMVINPDGRRQPASHIQENYLRGQYPIEADRPTVQQVVESYQKNPNPKGRAADMAKKTGEKEKQLREMREQQLTGGAAGNGKAENPEALLSEFEQLGNRATAGMDTLIERKKTLRAEADQKKASIDDELAEKLKPLDDQIHKLDTVYNRATGRWYVTGAKTASKSEGRQRRSAEQLGELAKEIHTFVKGKGKSGAGASEIVQKFGKLQLPPAAFVEKYGGGLKLGKSGEKAQTRYSAD